MILRIACDAKRKRKRAMRPIRPSRANELWYVAELRRIVARLKSVTNLIVLPGLKSKWPAVSDALPPGTASVIAKGRAQFAGISRQAKRLAEYAAKRNLRAVDKRVIEEVRRAVGVDLTGLLRQDKAITRTLERATRDNVALIESIPAEHFDKIEEAVASYWTGGTRWESLAGRIKEIGDVTDSRARLIARDQTSKMNAAFNQTRQTGLGIETYTWQTSSDERVRESHAELDGETFSWDDPPDVDGEPANPGEPINCRCVALPNIDIEAIEAEAAALEEAA